jgi:ATP phosphoribosyltransferase
MSIESRDRLRIAIQKSGRLTEPSQELLQRCGLSFRTSRDKLFCYGESLPIDLLLVRDDDIPGLIEQGVCELGIVGRNVAREYAAGRRSEGATVGFREVLDLGFGPCRLSIAIPQDERWDGPRSLQGRRIATSYPALLQEYLERNQVQAGIVVLNGAVEIAPRLGTADCICDLVSSGATLHANQLHEVDRVLESEAILIEADRQFGDEREDLRRLLLRRLDGVLKVRESKLVLLHARREALAAIVPLLPKAEAPSVLPLEGADGAVAVQALCRDQVTWHHLEELKRAGASQLLVLPVEKILA